ncbi:TPR domain protein, partial [Aureobasidium melanogenum]
MPAVSINAPAHAKPTDGYFNLGTYSRKISTKNPEAQLWFDRGLIWAYGFNIKEASICFEKVTRLDPECAMGYWGIAYTKGPYYNKAWRLFDPRELKEALVITHETSRKALELSHNATPVEKALIKALVARYPQKTPTDDYQPWNVAYVNAMEEVYRSYKDDLDVACLYAESLMVLTPWALWNIHTGEPARGARPYEAKEALDHAFTLPGAWEHPALLHFYIHLMEMSKTPECAVQAADSLRGLVPDSGHLEHMPSHLYVLIGDYRAGIAANASAVRADDAYVAKMEGNEMYTFYRAHNSHSLIYAALLSGKSEVALQNCTLMENYLPEELLAIESPNMADWLESFLGVRAHLLVRFGRWEEIISLEMPKNKKLYCVTTATLHYAKGVAYSALGNIAEAEKEQESFLAAQKLVPESRFDFPNKCTDILKVGEAMLAGEIEYRKGNIDLAFEHLRESIKRDDNLVYSEPWGWMQPTRHAYAALSLEQGLVEQAAQAYAEDLGFVTDIPRGHQHPNNVWALVGYRECLKLLGREAEYNQLEQPYQLAIQMADIPVTSSCYCRGMSEQIESKKTKCNGSC